MPRAEHRLWGSFGHLTRRAMTTQVVPFDEPSALTLTQVVPYDQSSSKPQGGSQAQSRPGSNTPVYDRRTDDTVTTWAAKADKPAHGISWALWFEGLGLLSMAVIDNALAYLTFVTVRAFHGRLYNVVDLHMTLLPGIDIILLGFAGLGTLTFVMMVILVECLKLPLYHELMNFRLFFSAMPSGIVSAILLYHSERTQWAPFATVVAVLSTVFVWCLHMRVQYRETLNVLSKILLDISWLIALLCVLVLVLFFAADQLKLLTRSDELMCPYAPNELMPVRVLPLERWYCAPWDEDAPMLVSRAPVNSVPVQLTCSDSFIAAFGVSIEPHVVACPDGCLRTFNPSQGTNVVGCGVYGVDSPVCVAAIHAGALTDTGGQATVYGRVGVSHFKRCSRNSVTSVERYVTQTDGSVTVSQPASGSGSSPFLTNGGRRLAVTVPSVVDPQGKAVPQAFHFNNDQPGGLPQTREFIWLKRYNQVSTGNEAGKPWTQIEATLSLRFAGIELEDEKVRLGQGSPQQLFIQPRPGQVFDARPTECRIRESGVMCKGAGAAVAQLDFCRTEVKQCPDK